jgi:hypothetical protein
MSSIDRRCDLDVRFIGYWREYTGRFLKYPANSAIFVFSGQSQTAMTS